MGRRTKIELKQYVRRFTRQQREIRLCIPNHLVKQYNIQKGKVRWFTKMNHTTKQDEIIIELAGHGTRTIHKSGSTLYVNVPSYIRAVANYPEDQWVHWTKVNRPEALTFILKRTTKPPIPRAVRKDYVNEYVEKLRNIIEKQADTIRDKDSTIESLERRIEYYQTKVEFLQDKVTA